MRVKGDSWNEMSSVSMTCPNLRRRTTGKFLGKTVYSCSVSGEELNYSYVSNVCEAHKYSGGYWNLKYPDCNHYKRCGICN